MDRDSTDEKEARQQRRASGSSSDSESERSSTRSRDQSRGRSRVRSRGRRTSVFSEPGLQNERTDKSKDRSRGRSRDRYRPGPDNVSPRRARSMSRPPSMERVPEFSFERRSRSLDRYSHRSRRTRSNTHSPCLKRKDSLFSKSRGFMRCRDDPIYSQGPRDSPDPGCALCGSVSTDLVSSGCGHSFCRDCWWSLDEPGSNESNQTQQISSALLSDYKRSLEKRNDSVSEGLETGPRTVNLCYPPPLITQDLDEDDGTQHEEKTVRDLFKPPLSDLKSICQKPVKVVLTRGVAGMGKTVTVQKFTLDWAQGSENQDLDLVLPLSFRELNLARWGHYSLLELIQALHPSLKGLTAEGMAQSKVLFIFDALDESRLPLDFSCEVISEVTQRSEVATLFMNLIKGHLLPDALIWITSRSAAASQIPVQYVDRFTRISGFTSDQQKEQFFRRRFRDEEQFERVLSFIKTSSTLWSMCQSPLFCWTTATVLEHRFQSEQSGSLSLTELFSYFVLVQMHTKKCKYQCASDFQLMATERELLLKLGRLAFQLLHNGTTLFDQKDLQMEELDLTEALVYSGLCTEVFQQHSVIFSQSAYSFVHPSVQDFLAAFYMHHSSNKLSTEEMKLKFLQDPNTPLQLLHFLHELSLEQNHRLLGALLDLTPTHSDDVTL